MKGYNPLDLIKYINPDEVLLDVSVKINYLYLGGYNTQMFYLPLNYVEELTGKQLKGIWRWWVRTFVSRVYGGSKTYLECNNIMADKLYLGGGKDVKPSKVSVVVETTNGGKKINLFSDKKPKVPNRIERNRVRVNTNTRWKLRTQSIRPNEWRKKLNTGFGDLYESKYYRIYLLYSGKNEDVEKFLVYSFLSTLMLDGVGWAKNRGFGSITPMPNIYIKKSIDDGVSKTYKEFIENMKRGNVEKAKYNISAIIDRGINYLKMILGIKSTKIADIPRIPTINADLQSKYFKLEIIRKDDRDVFDMLECIGKSVLKAYWKRYQNIPGRKLHTWVLGLPRFAKLKSSRFKTGKPQGTGYVDIDNNLRFPSSIRLKILDYYSEDNKGRYIMITGFLFRELEEVRNKLRHCNNYGCVPLNKIENSNPKDAFIQAWSNVTDIIKRC